MIYNIQRFCTHDGEGIRTIIFYKGCPLHCQWCSNPESQSFFAEIMYNRSLCKKFGECIKVEPENVLMADGEIQINRSAIRNPENYREVCFCRALTVVGETRTTDELISEIEKDLPFYRNSGGGVTLSGGEPLAQGSDFIVLLQELNKRKIDISIETSLYAERDKIEKCLGLNCTFLADLKHINRSKFKEYTGGNLSIVLANLNLLAEMNEKIIIRIPVIAGFNHSYDEMKGIIDYVNSLDRIREIHFIPYHNLGVVKYDMLGRKYAYHSNSNVEPSELTGYTVYANSLGLITKTGG